jgi:hypothetical protein
VLPGRDFLQFLEFKNGDFCDPDAPPPADLAAAQATHAPCPEPSDANAGGCDQQLLSRAGQEERGSDTWSLTWDPQWLLITRLFHPLFPSTPSAMLPTRAAALSALASATADCSLVPPPFELPAAPVVDPASNLQVPLCSLLFPLAMLLRLQPLPLPPSHALVQTAALLKQLQLQPSFCFSQEQQKHHLAHAFGCTPRAASAQAAPAPPHGSSRVAAFLASNQAAGDVSSEVPALQQRPDGASAANPGVAAANPDEISLE